MGGSPRLKLLGKDGRTVWLRRTIERARREAAEKAATEARSAGMIGQLADGPAQVAAGEPSSRIETPFEGEFEAVRQDFNRACERLSAMVAEVLAGVEKPRSSSGELGDASANLAKRLIVGASPTSPGTLGCPNRFVPRRTKDFGRCFRFRVAGLTSSGSVR